ncbi:MAG: hypothetical protein PF447_08005, partial [Spirochaetaceae bacterium]|nr:hypothetical protein [Spirochaetaceae bacterium]
MARNAKYSYGSDAHRKRRLYLFEKKLQEDYVNRYRKHWKEGGYQLPPDEESLLQAIQGRKYKENPRLLPRFLRILWEKQSIEESFFELKGIWEEENHG